MCDDEARTASRWSRACRRRRRATRPPRPRPAQQTMTSNDSVKPGSSPAGWRRRGAARNRSHESWRAPGGNEGDQSHDVRRTPITCTAGRSPHGGHHPAGGVSGSARRPRVDGTVIIQRDPVQGLRVGHTTARRDFGLVRPRPSSPPVVPAEVAVDEQRAAWRRPAWTMAKEMPRARG